MRYPFFILLFVCLATVSHGQVIISLLFGDKLNSGQVEFGLDGGVNYSWQNNVPYGKSYPVFNLGFYFDIKTKHPMWLIHTGVIVVGSMGAGGLPVYSLNNPDLDNSFASGSVDRSLSYFNVPFMAKRKFNNHFYVEAGPMFGLLYGAKDTFSAEVDGQQLTYVKDINDLYRRLDAGVVVGIGYRLMGGNGMNIGIRGYQGFVNVLAVNPGPSVTNQSLYFNIGIPIGAGKAREREAQKESR